MISIDPTAKISPLADIEDSVRGSKIIIGACCKIDSFVKILPVGGSGDVKIGEHSVLNSGCVLYSGNGITIGKQVSIAANTTFAATNHAFADRSVPIQSQGFLPSKGGIILEDDVWIGANCVLLDGAHIKHGAVIGAGTVVRGEVAPYSIVVGTPNRVIGWRS